MRDEHDQHDQHDEAEDVRLLRAAAFPLAGVDPALRDDDLLPLLARLRGARLIGLGEATHGDGESFLFKHRLIRALVRRRGVRLVLFERGPAEMDAYDRYVTGQTNTLSMGEDLYPWRTAEVRDLFEWLRAWNRRGRPAGRPGTPVRLAGVDVQSPLGLRLALPILDELGLAAPAAWHRLAAEAVAAARPDAWYEAALLTWCAGGWPILAVDPADARGRWALLLADTFRQWLEMQLVGRRPDSRRLGYLLRDRFMAANALAQLERFGPTTRAVLWAHNDHVRSYPWFPLAGRRLRAALGSAYRAVGFACGRGRFNAGATDASRGAVDRRLRPYAVRPPPPDAMEALLDRLGLACCAVAPGEAAPLRRDWRRRAVGTPYSDAWDQFDGGGVPADWYDLLVYFREVHPSRVLGAGGDGAPGHRTGASAELRTHAER